MSAPLNAYEVKTLEEALQMWKERYEFELDSCDKWDKWCEKHEDSHGKCFYQGMRSGLVNTDIFLNGLKKFLELQLETRKVK